jgi:hypothetical protein
MQADRLNRILGVLAVLYVGYIAIALLWSRLRDAMHNGKRRTAGLSGSTIQLQRPRQAHLFRKTK